ncbi:MULTISPECIES: hypothetical protein [Eikenella]|nr:MULTISPECIES: hypothetical protein [Eikenella]
MPTCLPQTARKVDGREADVARLNQAGQYLFPPGAGFFIAR